MSEKTLELLSDMLRLARKYGSAEFNELADLLEDPGFREKAVAILRGVAKVSDEHAGLASPQSAESDALRAEVLLLARSRISDKECYPHLRDLADELARLGMPVPASGFRRREDVLRAVTKFITGLSLGESQSFVDQLRAAPQRGALEEWSEIIMERKP